MIPSFNDNTQAWVPHGLVHRISGRLGPLSGVSVAVKDVMDWAGVPTGAGNPAWLQTHPVPDHDAAAVACLVEAGADLHGKTITDELAYSLQGENFHYGTPVNASAPDRVPGGSSSGSAAAVSGGAVDAALGTDTGGSVRVPAAYCGLWGLRTTHGLVDRAGVVPLAPRFDTVGWLARSPQILEQVGQVLLPASAFEPRRLARWPEADALADEATRKALDTWAHQRGLPQFDLGEVAAAMGGLEGLRRLYVTSQQFEAWQVHGAWVSQNYPVFGPDIAARFLEASKVTAAQADEAGRGIDVFRAALRALLGNDAVVVLPTAAGPAPLRNSSGRQAERLQTLRLTSPASLSGLPQLTLPFEGEDGLARGIGIIAPAAADRGLIRWAVTSPF